MDAPVDRRPGADERSAALRLALALALALAGCGGEGGAATDAGPRDDGGATADAGAGCGADSLEPNDAAESATAFDATLGFARSGLSLCAGDTDVFLTSLADGVALWLTVVEASPDLAARPIAWTVGGSWDGAERLAEGELTATGVATPLLVAPMAGPYTVTLRTVDGGPIDLYALRFEVRPAEDVSCVPGDAFEPNDARETAPTLSPGVYPDLTVCRGTPTDWDVWSFELQAGDTAEATVERTAGAGTAEVTFYDPYRDGIILASRLTADRTGRFYLGVDPGPRPGGARYTLHFTITPGAAPPSCDESPDDDTLATAAPMTAGTDPSPTITAAVCAGDDDYYAFHAERDELLTAALTYPLLFGAPSVALLAPDGTVLAESADVLERPGGEGGFVDEVRATARATGTHYVRMQLADGGDPTPYLLGVAREAGVPCSADPQEPNDDRDAPSLPVLDHPLSGYACVGDEDWFRLDTTLPLSRLLLGASGATPGDRFLGALEIVDASSGLATGTAYLERGSYRVLVTSRGTNVAYSLEPRVVDATICRDALEPNDADPVAVTAGVRDLGLCNGYDDRDRFELTVAAGQRVTVRLDFRRADGDIDLRVVSRTEGWIRYSETLTDVEQYAWTAAAAGPVEIEAYLVGPDALIVPYRMTITVE